MQKSKKEKLKEKRTLLHIINTCEKNKIGYKRYSTGSFEVSDFNGTNFTFSQSTVFCSVNELRDLLDVYIKHHKTSHL